MNYQKKVLVLKQVCDGYSVKDKRVNGVARIECENGVCDFYLSIIDLKGVFDGSYYVYLADNNQTLYSFDLGKRPTYTVKKLSPCPDLSQGFTASVCHMVDGLPCQVASGKTPDCPISIEKLNTLIADTCLSLLKQQQKDKTTQERKTDTATQQLPATVYDDEAVATENYFDTDQKIQNRLNAIKEWDFEDCCNEDELFNSSSKKEAPKKQGCDYATKNEASFCTGKKYSQQNPYYLTAKAELENIFDKFPSESCLKGIFPDSRWAKINYAQGKYYLVGVIKENFTEKYICYGVPATYGQQTPPQLDGYCTFVPISLYDLHGEGFWMMFQDAVTGNCLKPTFD